MTEMLLTGKTLVDTWRLVHVCVMCLKPFAYCPLTSICALSSFGMFDVYGCNAWSLSHSGMPYHFGSPSAVEALRQHRRWLVNFQRDISMISSTARYSRTGEPLYRVNDLQSDDQYPLFNFTQPRLLCCVSL